MPKKEDKKQAPMVVTDLDALKDNAEEAVVRFADRYLSVPRFTEHCEVMDQGQLRDAMGLRATFGAGDPWPQAEKLLLEMGFRWHILGGVRVMFLQERDDLVQETGWEDATEAETEEQQQKEK